MSGRSRSAARATRRRRTWWAVAAGVAAVLALGGILFVPAVNDGGRSGLAPAAVSMTEYAYAPAQINVAAGQELLVRNDGAIVHNLLIGELAKGIELQSGDSGSLLIPADAEGTYRVICDLPGHVEQGMVGTLVVG